jgi:hypothetical protein
VVCVDDVGEAIAYDGFDGCQCLEVDELEVVDDDDVDDYVVVVVVVSDVTVAVVFAE